MKHCFVFEISRLLFSARLQVVVVFRLFNHIPGSVSTGPSSLTYCPIQLVSTSNWAMSSAFLTFTQYLVFYHLALCSIDS